MIIMTDKLEVIFVKSPNCGICLLMEGTWRKLKERNPDVLFSTKLINESVQKMYNINLLPSFVFCKGNNVLTVHGGSARLYYLENLIKTLR